MVAIVVVAESRVAGVPGGDIHPSTCAREILADSHPLPARLFLCPLFRATYLLSLASLATAETAAETAADPSPTRAYLQTRLPSCRRGASLPLVSGRVSAGPTQCSGPYRQATKLSSRGG